MVNTLKSLNSKFIFVFLVLAFFIIAPLFFGNDRYTMGIIILCFIWSVVASSWDLILGYASVFSFGHLAFVVIGGYTSGLLSMYLGFSPWIGILFGGLISGLFGFLIAIPCLKLEGLYLAIATFAFQLALPTFIVFAGPGRFDNWSTGGNFGLQPVPPPTLFGYTFSTFEIIPWYYLTFIIFLIFQTIIFLIIKSPIGLAFIALRDSNVRARTLGINAYKYKLLVFTLSAVIAGFIGAFYAHYFGLISPVTIGLDTMLIVLVMVMFGGLGEFPGAIIGAFVITILNELLRVTLTWRLVILGAIVIIVMIYFPKGLMGLPVLGRKIINRISLLFKQIGKDGLNEATRN